MLSSSLDALFQLSKTTSPQKLFDYNCITLYTILQISCILREVGIKLKVEILLNFEDSLEMFDEFLNSALGLRLNLYNAKLKTRNKSLTKIFYIKRENRGRQDLAFLNGQTLIAAIDISKKVHNC